MDQLDIHLTPFTYTNLLAIGDLLTPDALKTEADFYDNQKRDQMAKKDHAGLVLRYDKRHKVAVYDMIMLGNFLNVYNHTNSSDYTYFSVKGVLSDKQVADQDDFGNYKSVVITNSRKAKLELMFESEESKLDWLQRIYQKAQEIQNSIAITDAQLDKQ